MRRAALLDYLTAVVLGLCLAAALVHGLCDERGEVPAPAVYDAAVEEAAR